MKLLHYVKLHNFKVFGEEKYIELDQPSVLVGPNNSGKTSTLQALALWSIGLKRWYETKGNSKATKNLSSGLNRYDIIQVPVQEARFFWKNTEVRKGSANSNLVPLEISVGIFFEGKVHDCKMVFTHYTPEIIYCVPEKSFYENKGLVDYAKDLNIQILYPMSGISTEETLIPQGRRNVLIGEGKTAEVLRNLCYDIVENDKTNKTKQWAMVAQTMKKLFNIDLQAPTYNQNRGSIELKYKIPGVNNALDLSLSGRGQQQMLLLLAYLFANHNCVLLLDEPDAHLEILRQKAVFTLLRDLASVNKNQVIIATHSEVILDEAAETNLVMLIDGEPINISKKQDVKSALRDFGMEHYYKAKLKKAVLYVEGSTDIDMLATLARHLGHGALSVLESELYYYYTQNPNFENNTDNKLEQQHGAFLSFKKHFYALKPVVPEFKGIAIFDSDGRRRNNELESDELKAWYWQRYELENYFVTPQVLEDFVRAELEALNGPLFREIEMERFLQIMDSVMLRFIFNNQTQVLSDYKQLSPALKENYWLNTTANIKLSAFAEDVFETYSKATEQPILLNKGNYYKMIPYMAKEKIAVEITQVLDLVAIILAQ